MPATSLRQQVNETRELIRELPNWIKWAVLMQTVIALIPIGLIVKSRWSHSELTRQHLFQDMDAQPKYKPQLESAFFADGRAMRAPLDGTVSWAGPLGWTATRVSHIDWRGGDNPGLREDDHFWRGTQIVDGKPQFATALPRQIAIDAKLLDRGRERFNIYCAPCHGYAAEGNGVVHLRATELRERWTAPANLHSDAVLQRPVGYLFSVISNGFNNMPKYDAQIPTEDRWAIVAWIKVLQRAGAISISDIQRLAGEGKLPNSTRQKAEELTQGAANGGGNGGTGNGNSND